MFFSSYLGIGLVFYNKTKRTIPRGGGDLTIFSIIFILSKILKGGEWYNNREFSTIFCGK